MVSNRLAFLALGAACVAAAGAGSYFATRQNTVAPVQAAASAPASTAPGATAPTTSVPSTTTSVEAAAPVTSATAAPAGPITAAAEPTHAPLPVPAKAPAAASARRAEAPDRTAGRQPAAAPPAASAAETTAADRTWPAIPPPPAGAASNTPEPEPQPATADDHAAQRSPEPPARRFEDLVVAADSVIGLRTDTRLSSERSRVEDRVEAKVVRDVRVGGRVAVPAGSKALGTVVVVERGGKFKERARIGIRFDELQLPDGTRLPLSTETIYRYGEAPGNSSAAKIGGGAVAGAILGAIIGGGKGAAVGAASGAGAGTAVVGSGDRSEATFLVGEQVTARILAPLTITVERE